VKRFLEKEKKNFGYNNKLLDTLKEKYIFFGNKWMINSPGHGAKCCA
jgi:hypothetical protein